DHPSTLIALDNIAGWTGFSSDAAGALSLYRELLPDMVRVLGPDNVNTLIIRRNIAGWTRECGDAAGALSLYRELLPDQVRVLGPDHPNTVATQNNIAYLAGPVLPPTGSERGAVCREHSRHERRYGWATDRPYSVRTERGEP
ncbi:MAG: tetratricopeptide repeat protein, partial [Streptosporangiaceae bacterium]